MMEDAKALRSFYTSLVLKNASSCYQIKAMGYIFFFGLMLG